MKRFLVSATALMRVPAAALLVSVLFPHAVLAQAYPARTIRMIMPYPAGGSGDIIGRLIAQHLSVSLKQTVIVDNRPGAAGSVGTELASKAAADGYALLFAVSTNAINVTLQPKLPYDLVKDFDAVALVARALQVFNVHPSIPAKSVKEFVALAKSQPSKLNYASSGSGTSGHLAMERLKRAAGIDVVHIPYKGNAPALNDLLGGQVAAMFGNLITAVPYMKSGRLRALGVTGLQRSVLAPDVPTIAESGYPGFEVIAWFSIMVPAGTPKPVVNLLNAEIRKMLDSNEGRERLLALGAEPVQDVKTPEQFGAFLKADIANWAVMIRESGIRPD